jgi:hypothetical protein
MLFKTNPFSFRRKDSGSLPPVESGVATPRRPRRDFKLLYPREMLIEVIVSGNPKRNGSQAARRFELYKSLEVSLGVITVGEVLDAGVLYKDIDYDWHCNYIALNGASPGGTFDE